MEIDVKEVWEVFKNEPIEKQYVFYQDQEEDLDRWFAFKISKNETASQGVFDRDYFLEIMDELKGKPLYVIHNHIDDDPKPSPNDYRQRDYFASLFRLSGLIFEDYVIVSPYGFVSFKNNGLMNDIKPLEEENLSDISKIEHIKIEKLDTARDIVDVLEELKQESVQTEYLVTPTGVFSSPRFSIQDLYATPIRESVFVVNGQTGSSLATRLFDLSQIFRFKEIYVLIDDQMIPLKKMGTL
jgi:hypothetical protein